MKLVQALWDSDQTALMHRSVRGDLTHAGVDVLQLNLDDQWVAPGALRLNAFDRAPDALVSTWGGDLGTVLEVIGSKATEAVAWRVEETRQVEPPTVPSGERADLLSQVALLRRPAELDRATWLERWQGQHTTVAVETQQTVGYVQDVVLEQVVGHPARVDGIVEELFLPGAAGDPHVFYGSGGDDDELSKRMTELFASVQRIGADRDLTVLPTSRYVFELTGRS